MAGPGSALAAAVGRVEPRKAQSSHEIISNYLENCQMARPDLEQLRVLLLHGGERSKTRIRVLTSEATQKEAAQLLGIGTTSVTEARY